MGPPMQSVSYSSPPGSIAELETKARLVGSLDGNKDAIVAAWLDLVGEDSLVRYPDLDRYLRSLVSGLCEVFREDDWTLTQTIIDGLAQRRAIAGGWRLDFGVQRALLAGRYAMRTFMSEPSADDLLLEALHECVFRYFESYQGFQLNSETERVHTRIIRSLVMALEARDPYTKGHSVQVALLSQRVAEALGRQLDSERAYYAGLLHDVGKVGIPDSILQKPGPLTDNEWRTMRTHPTTGASILKPIKLFPEVVSAVLAHHENHDGSGYPSGSSGEEIPAIAKIIRIVDSFDAMTSTRVHKPSVSITEAVEEIVTQSGSLYDPRTVEAFIKTVEAPGTMRELSMASLQIDLQDFSIEMSPT